MAAQPVQGTSKKTLIIGAIVVVAVLLFILKASGALKFNFEITRNGQPVTQVGRETQPQPTTSYQQQQQQSQEETKTMEAPANESTKGYQNFRYGFSLNYPASWRLQEVPSSGVIVGFYSPKEGLNDQFIENANVTVFDTSANPPEDVEELTDMWWKDAQGGFPEGSINLVSNDEDVIYGLDARTITYTLQNKGLNLKGQATMTLKGNKAYIITFTGEESAFDKNMDNVDILLDTFIIN